MINITIPTYTASFNNGDLSKRYQEKYTLILIPRGKRGFQKKITEILVDKHIQEQQQKEDSIYCSVDG